MSPRRFVPAVVAALLLAGASAASAHIDPTPTTVAPGKKATITFHVEHGCGTSPTTRLAIRVPAGVTNVAPVAKPGWRGAVTGRTVTFSGGRLPKAGTFSVTLGVPRSPNTTLVFPIIQTCAKGHTDWIEPTVAGADEPDHPAPVVRIAAR